MRPSGCPGWYLRRMMEVLTQRGTGDNNEEGRVGCAVLPFRVEYVGRIDGLQISLQSWAASMEKKGYSWHIAGGQQPRAR